MLRYCSYCKENSIVLKLNKNKTRILFCINKGCGYKQMISVDITRRL